MATQQEDYQQGMQLLSDSAAIFEAETGRIQGVTSELEAAAEDAIHDVGLSVSGAVASLAKNNHKYYVDPLADESIADGTSAKPFKYVRDALVLAPLGGRVEIEVPNSVDFWFSDPSSTNHLNTHFYAAALVIRTKNTDNNSKSKLKFATIASGDNTRVSGFGFSGMLYLTGVELESPDLINSGGVGEVCIESLGNLKILTYASGFIVGDNPLLGSGIYGDIEHCFSGFEFAKKPNATKTILHTSDVRHNFNMTAYYGITIEGSIEDYFKSSSSGFVTWNKSAVGGNQ